MNEEIAEVIKAGSNLFPVVEAIISAATDVKGENICLMDVSRDFNLADAFVVISARSDRQVQGIASRIVDTLDKMGIKLATREGYEQGHWVLLDFNQVIVHVFYAAERARINIEGLWAKSPKVTIKSTIVPDELEAA